MNRAALAALVVSGLVWSACSPPPPPDAPPRPDFVKDGDADRTRVSMVKSDAAPFTVDWKFEYRKALENRMRRGTVVVAFTEKKLQVLPDCTAPGKYDFVGSSPGREFASAHNTAELEANFPFSAGSLKGRLATEGSLLADLRPVGTSNLDRPRVVRTDLTGTCEEATHYVIEILHGGFVFGGESAVEAAAKAGVMGMGAQGGMQSAGSHIDQEGVLADCDNASADAKSPPSKCAGVLQIRMVPIAAADAPAAQAAADKKVPSCGEGLRWNGVSCASEARALAATPPPTNNGLPSQVASANKPQGFACDGTNAQDCLKQCQAGNADSCAFLGMLIDAGAGVPRDPVVAEAVLRVACRAQSSIGCVQLARVLVEAHRYAEAVPFAQQSCDAGDADGCTELGYMLQNGYGVAADKAKAFDLYARACKRRQWMACNNAGVMIAFGGAGVKGDLAAGCKMFEQVCDAMGPGLCSNYAFCVENAIGEKQDLDRALKLYMSDCDKGIPFGCVWGGLLYEAKAVDMQASAKALQVFEAACDMQNAGSCVTTSDLMTALPGRYSLASLDRRACDGADTRGVACYNAALLNERGGMGFPKNTVKAGQELAKACKQFDLKRACRPPAGF